MKMLSEWPKCLACIAIIILLAVIAWLFGGVTPSYKPRLTSANPECPVNWKKFVVYPRLPSGGYDTTKSPGDKVDSAYSASIAPGSPPAPYGFSLPNAISDVPEFHDCQRMRFKGKAEDYSETMGLPLEAGVSGDIIRYGAVMGVFAGERLDAMPDSLFDAPQAVAEVFVPEPGIYRPLGISNTFNCVVLQHLGADEGWAAWMVPVTREAQCKYRFPRERMKDDWKLSVVALPLPERVDSSYVPPVARWDWDDKNNKQVIGVPCKKSWCWLGDKNGIVPPPSIQLTQGSEMERAIAGIPGYSDRQQLAEWDTEKKLYPGQNWGTVMPTPALQDALYGGPPGSPKMRLGDKLANFNAKWTHVANVFMGPETGPYGETLNFEADPAGPPQGKHAEIYLCRGNGIFDCRPNLPYLFIKRTCHTSKSDGVRWYAKIEQSNGKTKYFCVVYCQHCNMQIPAVTRWRWRLDDEGVWVSCPEGCCETNADES